MYRRTKIVATMGPACTSPDILKAMMEAGANVFRLNFSHGSHEEKAQTVSHIRQISRERRQAVAILGDLQGPKMRVGQLQNGAVELKAGHMVCITTQPCLGTDQCFSTDYQALPQDVKPGDTILLDDGLLQLRVDSATSCQVHCHIEHGGILRDRKGINLPGVSVSAPSFTQKDKEDLFFCLEQELDYVALSFVRTPHDILQLKHLLWQDRQEIPVIAKIEKPEAVDNIDAILEQSDGIMVARGDLGVELPAERVPLLQKQIIRKSNQAGKPVITATQMLESMVTNPCPTRAEVSDVANAILDGSDALMLSAETASGGFPVAAVALMARVCADVETDPQLKEQVFHPIPEVRGYRRLPEAIAQAACRVAENVDAKAVLAFTQTGYSASLVSKYRPALPIFAVTPAQSVRRRLALFAGVSSMKVAIEGDTEAQIQRVEETVLAAGVLQRGDVVVITMGSPVSAPGTTNLLKVHRLGTGPFYEVH